MPKNSSNSSGENGNTKHSTPKKSQVSPSVKWCFTYNNYPINYHSMIDPILKENCKKFVYGEEVGESGTPHLQGSIWLKTKMRPDQLKLDKKIHWEKMRNEEASIKYCQKDSKVTIHGFPKPIKILNELRKWQADIENLIINNEPDGRTINWYWEATGGTGKSSFCKYMFVKHGTLIIQGGKLADISNIIFNSNMDEITAVVIDIPRVNSNKVSYAAIECILNGMITNTKYETGVKVFNPPHVVVFANDPPETESLSKDRWKVTEISNDRGAPSGTDP